MKKNFLPEWLCLKNPTAKQIFSIMRITTFLLCACAFSTYAENSFSQSARVSINKSNTQLDEVLNEIENQTDYLFVYNNQVNVNRKVTVQAETKPVSEILDNLFRNSGIEYAMEGTHIILTKASNKAGVSAPQQTKKVTGTVLDEMGEPITGANVFVKGTTNGNITDIDGNFSLSNVPANAVIQFSFIGYLTQEVPLKNQTTINVKLVEDSQMLDEVVVVGFGTQKKVNLTGSVSTVDAKALESRPISTATQALQGLVPGLNFSYSGSGNGGEMNNNMKMNIRGGGTIGEGSNSSPLILIDGMEGDINNLNPQDIDNVSVLKDAAASSIYGSRAPFGVILITTKKGKAGKISLNYNNSFRWSSPVDLPQVADSYTYAKYLNRASANIGDEGFFPAEQLQRIKEYQEGTFLPTTIPSPTNPAIWDWSGNSNNNWYDIYFRNAAFSQEHAVSANGGSEKVQFYLSGNFLDQGGLIEFNTDQMKRYTMTGKININPFSWLSMNYSTKFIRNDYRSPSYMGNNQFYHDIAKRWPMEPFLDPNGHGMSMAESLLQGGTSSTQTDDLYQQFQLVLEPLKGWKVFGELNYRSTNKFYHYDSQIVTTYNVANDPIVNPSALSSVEEQASKTNFFNPNVYTEYSKELSGGHSFKAMVGFQAELNKFREVGASRINLISPDLPALNAASGTDKITKGGVNHWATAGFFGRINYNYKERYMVEVNARYDGTSRFLDQQRWNWFPSVSLGWNLAREAFMEPYLDYLSVLKIRGSWGELGNQNTTSLYPYYQLLKFKASDDKSYWLLNGNRPNTADAPDLISALLGWETMRSWNIGIDIAMLRNRLTIGFDYFNRQTIDMVGPAPELPVILGTAVPKTNNADLESNGFELDLGWRDQIGKVEYGAHLLLSDDRQKITRFSNPTGTLNTWYEGQRVGDIWGYVTHGIAKSDEEMNTWLENHKQSQIGNNWAAGDIMYEDLNNDGEINDGNNTVKDSGDKKVIGNNTPRFKFGLDLNAAWKGIDVRLFFQGVAKRDYWMSDNMAFGASGDLWQSTCWENHLDFFRSEGDEWGANLDAFYPRPAFSMKNLQSQTRYLQNAAYIRLKNLQVGYSLPKQWISKVGLSNLRLYFSGENLFTITGLTDGIDPETIGSGYGNWGGGSSGSNKTYPLSRTFSAGLSITL